jgi:crossover junction endodeoxyribonuclease RuvC
MRVLAIDPGYDRVGVAVLEHVAQKEILLFSGCIETDKKASLMERIYEVGTAVSTLIETHSPTFVAIETLFFNKNVKTAIGVAQARGAIVYIAQRAGCEVLEYGPQEIKIAVTGYGKSDKSAVIAMIQRLVQNAPKKALDDEYDAIAVGITALAHRRS